MFHKSLLATVATSIIGFHSLSSIIAISWTSWCFIILVPVAAIPIGIYPTGDICARCGWWAKFRFGVAMVGANCVANPIPLRSNSSIASWKTLGRCNLEKVNILKFNAVLERCLQNQWSTSRLPVSMDRRPDPLAQE